MLDYSELPAHIQGGAKRYIEDGVPPGGFLRAVFENDLMQAFGRADHINRERMFEITSFVYNEAPSSCHGSPKHVLAWCESGGLRGQGHAVPKGDS